MKHSKLLLLSLLLVACYGQRSPEKPKLDIKAELAKIEETRNGFMLAIKEQRYQDLASFAMPEMEATGPDTEGWWEMRKLGKEKGAFPYDSLMIFPKETLILNDTMAYDYGTSKVYYTNAEGVQVELKDTFIVVLKKDEDGEWKMYREVASGQVK
ncbi:hypothetical protein [Ekhidna sp.]|uniref:hypothetical protein n=1 Tax=Ekhidna sp. TaxID=2608089 RepID=UPI003B5AEBBF